MTTTPPTTSCARLLQMVPAAIAAPGAIAAAMILTAPAANAIPESQIASECAQAGGSYHT